MFAIKQTWQFTPSTCAGFQLRCRLFREIRLMVPTLLPIAAQSKTKRPNQPDPGYSWPLINHLLRVNLPTFNTEAVGAGVVDTVAEAEDPVARAEVERAAREVEVKVVQAELVAPGGEAEEAVRAELTDTL